MGEISYRFLLSGGIKDLGYIKQIYIAKNHNTANNSSTSEAREKNKHRLGIHRFFTIFWCLFDKI